MKNKLLMLLLPLLMVGCGEVASSLNTTNETTSSVVEVTTSEEQTTENVTTEENVTSEEDVTTTEEQVTTEENVSTELPPVTSEVPPSISEQPSVTTEVVPPVIKYYTVSGIVKDNKGGYLYRTTVKLYNANYEQLQVTNDQGEFIFENVTAGTYYFTITKTPDDSWLLEKFTSIQVDISGDSLQVTIDDIVVTKDTTIWGPIYG